MKTDGQAAGRRVESAGYEGWTLTGYAWHSKHIVSPLTGATMRAVVGVDEKGRYRPGMRVNAGADIATTFDAKPALDKAQAISESRDMLRDRLIDHARQAAENTQKPGEIVDVRVDARALAIAEGRRRKAAESLREHDRMTAQAGQGEKSSPYQAGTELDGNYTTQEARDRAAHVPGLHERQGAAEKYGAKDSVEHEVAPPRRSR